VQPNPIPIIVLSITRFDNDEYIPGVAPLYLLNDIGVKKYRSTYKYIYLIKLNIKSIILCSICRLECLEEEVKHLLTKITIVAEAKAAKQKHN
jgi:hypothetical protein